MAKGQRKKSYSGVSPDIYYKVIQGKLLIEGYKPDGNSIRFQANNTKAFDNLYRAHKLRLSPRDHSVQLRFETADALEYHYAGHKQPGGEEARDYLLSLVGFDNIQYEKDTVKSSEPHSVPATILTNSLDPFGRPISYLLIDEQAKKIKDSSVIPVDDQMLYTTLNINLLSNGFAYHLLYTSTPFPHREYVRKIASTARNLGKGVWKHDQTSMYKLEDFASIEEVAIYPKLFRRSVDYLKTKEKGFEGDLADWLRSYKNGAEDDLVLIAERYGPVHLSDLLEQYNNQVVLKADLLELVFEER